jgi:hypothetical protein
MRVRGVSTVAAVMFALLVAGASGVPTDPIDPVRNVPIPCEVVNAGGTVPRSSENLEHIGNKCGFIGTDIEFQSRTDATGRVHDYAFVGSMGGGLRIFDITTPENPLSVTEAGGYVDPAWENDIQLRGNIAVLTSDGVNNEPSSGSACIRMKDPITAAGVDILGLTFDPVTATFTTVLIDCVVNPPGGAHNSTLSPNGKYLAISNCCSDFAIDIVDMRDDDGDGTLEVGEPDLRWRLIDSAHVSTTTCPTGATFTCKTMAKPDGSPSANSWRPHDVFFSANSQKMYVAAINSTWIVDFELPTGTVTPLALIPNGTPVSDPRNVSISHQADTTSDGKILIISDERGGGLTETGCNTDPSGSGVIGGWHFFALAPIDGQSQTLTASVSNPIKLGDYFTPPPLLGQDPLAGPLQNLRIERGCTIHVFRYGGNGSTSPGEISPGFDGVSRLPIRQAASAHYGAGTWWIDALGPSSNTDGITEDPRSTWGNTRGWIVMPGADTWSAKEYKGHIFTGDMVRGMDIFDFGHPPDPARNVPIPCELLAGPGAVPRTARNMVHVANVCGFVGSDIEFQSRLDSSGRMHDYAFVGTMGAGMRIFDITTPVLNPPSSLGPTLAGEYLDPGWQNDIQLRGDLAAIGFDPLVVGINVSDCLRMKNPSGSITRGGVDLVDLNFNPDTATFGPSLRDCYLNVGGGAHTETFNPRGEWLSIDTSSGNGTEVVDVRASSATPCAPLPAPCFARLVRQIPTSVVASAHDVFFSRDGNTLFSAGLGSTRIVDVSDIFNRAPTLIATIPNSSDPSVDNQTISISHQSDTTADEKILAITDERGGGLQNSACNTNPNGVVGGMHFWALDPSVRSGASLATPKKIGTWIYPNVGPAADPFTDPLPRAERGCTIHVFRFGGNGGASPGPAAPGFDGVSGLPPRQGVAAHYGAGIWWLDFSGAPSSTDGITEDPRTSWGNTRGWIVMPGTDAWSAKEYKGFVYAGDMGRGFDVYGFVGGAPPTAVKVSGLRAVRTNRAVRVTWRTGSEVGTLGFNVYRLRDGRLAKVNRTLVRAQNRPGGATYTVVDRTPGRASAYRLQVVGLDGSRTWRGTVTLRQ